jgi:uncharacterized RDD family membrane protein YckC
MAYPVQSDPTKVIGRRVLATLIDAVLVLVPVIVLVTSSIEYLPEDRLDRSGAQFCDDYLDADSGRLCFDMTDVDDRVYFIDSAPNGANLLFLALSVLMLVVLQGLTGWTIGKLVTGIRTVRADGRPPGLLKALVRWLLWIVDGFPYLLPLVGFITAVTTVGHRRVGDMAAGTYVVRASAAGAPIVVPGLTAPPPPAGYAPGVPWGTTSPPSPDAGWGTVTPSTPATSWGDDAPTSATPQTSAAPAASAPGPQWDEARGTYIQWDPAQGAWLQWDETTRAWIRIPGQ